MIGVLHETHEGGTLTDALRSAVPEDAAICARIKNDWIDRTEWMPRVHSAEDVEHHYREFVLKNRKVIMCGDPPQGYIALDLDEGFVTSLFVAPTGHGTGKLLLDHAKIVLDRIRLWTFQKNVGALRFYRREGFREIDRSDGDNEEHLPDVLLEWRAA